MLAFIAAQQAQDCGTEPSPGKQLPACVTDELDRILGYGLWIVFILCTAGVIVAGARLYFAWRSGNAGELVWLGIPLIAAIIASSAAAIAAQLISPF